MKVIDYRNNSEIQDQISGVQLANWPERMKEAGLIFVTCSLTDSSKYLVNEAIFSRVKNGFRLVNMARGEVIKEQTFEQALKSGTVYSDRIVH